MLQDRASTSSSHQGGEEDPTVRIEVFAHGAIGKEAVLVASLSNSVILVMRIGGGRGGGGGGGGDGNDLRSWLLDWPVSGKVRIDGCHYGAVRTILVSYRTVARKLDGPLTYLLTFRRLSIAHKHVMPAETYAARHCQGCFFFTGSPMGV